MLSTTKRAELFSSTECTLVADIVEDEHREREREREHVREHEHMPVAANGQTLGEMLSTSKAVYEHAEELPTESSMVDIHPYPIDAAARSFDHEVQDGAQVSERVENAFHDNVRLGIENAFNNTLSIGTFTTDLSTSPLP